MRSAIRIAWCGAIAALAVSTGCSGERSLGEKYPTQWKTCNALFGAKNMESLRDILDSDDLKFSNDALSVDRLKRGLTQEATEPYDEIKGFEGYDACGLSGNGRFSAMVGWAADSLKDVQTYTERWHRAAADVYVADTSGVGGDVDLVFRCEIKGAVGQQAQVLLEARVNPPDSPGVSEGFHQQLAVKLARTLADELACANEPHIPDDLQLGE
ncbi:MULTISPECIES: hypothetical protein [Streptomyces]|uniref:hypothetical protein n=1 Tax=Streptomyces TaxID=1883 RepID=UPI0011816943|nr:MULTISPECIES: hypothetical protein [Streptomyces]MDX3582679.1 hypothetical protein [Streptomyces europaeiscabiei]MDX3618843.1 hypothetical protein [Streptomyces europaeiscabiei]MDX3634502.1 hypothetical protein [Streptomyces europaeiscabiei]MDX3653342.1 hypothetical protein [Streptomyces europaeiscabiei]WUD33252.1 hypothetical protein OG858_18685 [Streptomyces europaeiscabiei]